MKKKIIWSCIIIFMIVGTIMNYCDEDRNNELNKIIVGSDGTKYDSYKSACEAQDFQAALDWIDKYKSYDDEAKEYVFNSEMLYLISLHSEEASERIVYLLKEFPIPSFRVDAGATYKGYYGAYGEARDYLKAISRYNNRCNNVLDMAISQGDYKLAKRVISLMKKNVDIAFQDSEKAIIEISPKGVNNNDINAAKKKLIEAMGNSLLIDEDDESYSAAADSSNIE